MLTSLNKPLKFKMKLLLTFLVTGFQSLFSILEPNEQITKTSSCLAHFCLDRVNRDVSWKMCGKRRKRGSGFKENYGQEKIYNQTRFKSDDLGLLPSSVLMHRSVLVGKCAYESAV